MATAKRTTTRRAAPAKSGAAPAVPADKTNTVESDAPVTVDSATEPTPMERAEAEADAETARQQTEADAEPAEDPAPAQLTETEVAAEEAAPAVKEAPHPADLVTATAAAEAASFENENQAKVPTRDLDALKALADPSGLNQATPYPENGVLAPRAVKTMPILRDTYDWTREGDQGAVGRVVVDGFRVKVNGYYRFARKGDRVVAPTDVIDSAVARGVMLKEG